MKVIIDTNFIISAINFKIDFFSELRRIIDTSYTITVLDGTLDELEKLSRTGRGKDKAAAKLAISMIKVKGIKIIKTKKEKIVDDLIMDLVMKRPDSFLVATQDAGLKKRLKGASVKRIVIRKKQYLVIV